MIEKILNWVGDAMAFVTYAIFSVLIVVFVVGVAFCAALLPIATSVVCILYLWRAFA